MIEKADFSDDEWKTILASPMLVSTAVSMADPNGIWGMIKEGMTSARAVLEAKKDPDANALIQSLVAEIETSEGREKAKQGLNAELSAKTPDEIKAQALSAIAHVNQILMAKSPEHADAFKAWLIEVAHKVAESSSEGGFLGFGGVDVSEAEKVTLVEISKTLDVA